MAHEVVVVGGGIGGLTVAALLAARGVDVCLFERGSQVGGCAATYQKSGYVFENGYGLFGEWQPRGLNERIFSELPVTMPTAQASQPSFVVRLPDTDITVTRDEQQFELELRRAFPECADTAVQFYKDIAPLNRALKKALTKVPDLQTADQKRQMSAFFPNMSAAFQILKASNTKAAQHLASTSKRFQQFLDIQLLALGQCSTSECSYMFAAALLDGAREMFSLTDGAAGLAQTLANSIKTSGGKIRLDTPVLRLAYDSTGTPVGVDLLSGERVEASRAIVSNLTVWDTYGKLVGLSQTPGDIRKQLGTLTAYGAYLIYASLDASGLERLPSDHIFALTDSQDPVNDPTSAQLAIAISPTAPRRAPEGKRAVTIHAFTRADEWFTYHEDESDHETMDQQMLEQCWQRLHDVMPELGDAIEVIDTATPRTFYEDTRRKLGMVGSPAELSQPHPPSFLSHRTPFPNLFRVGDTCFPGGGIAGVTQSALIVADILAK